VFRPPMHQLHQRTAAAFGFGAPQKMPPHMLPSDPHGANQHAGGPTPADPHGTGGPPADPRGTQGSMAGSLTSPISAPAHATAAQLLPIDVQAPMGSQVASAMAAARRPPADPRSGLPADPHAGLPADPRMGTPAPGQYASYGAPQAGLQQLQMTHVPAEHAHVVHAILRALGGR
jgi:hypothetical protein